MTRLRTIRWRLPASVGGLLAVVVAALSWMAYREVRAAAVDAAESRMDDVARQVAGLLAQNVAARRAEARRAATDPSVAAVLRARSSPEMERAAAALGSLAEGAPATRAVTVWDPAGVFVVGSGPQPDEGQLAGRSTWPAWADADSGTVSGLRASNGVISYQVSAPVRDSEATLGYVLMLRQVPTSADGAQAIADLVGLSATFLVGEPGGTWTDFVDVADGPPIPAGGGVTSLSYGAGDRAVLGRGVPIEGTPWQLWLESPVQPVMERPRAFLSSLLRLGVVVVLVGTAAGAALSHGITARLGRLTSAARGIAGGDLGLRAEPSGDDELTELARAFNTMTQRVADARHVLEAEVAQRTAALAGSEARFRTLATAARDAIVTADQEGRILYFNPAAEDMFGYDAKDLAGESLTVLMPERFREPHRKALGRYSATGQGKLVGTTIELVGLRSDGTEFPVGLSLASHRREADLTFIGIIRDITTAKEHEEALSRYSAELEAANAQLEAFSYSVAHDLRAPLRAINGFSQVLADDFATHLDEAGLAHLSRVCAAAEHMEVLIDDLLALSRATRAEMRPEAVDLSGLAGRIAADLQNESDRRADFRIQERLTTRGDRRLLTQALRNLIENAWKFTSKLDRTVIEVGVSSDAEAFFVRDNGAGFDMAYVDKLFHPFQRLHSSREFPGTGIGLALVERIVGRHGGRVWAEGSVGRGATFYFSLPEA